MGIFHELRQKPNHIKSRYAFIGATILTLGVGIIWVTSLPARFSNISESVKGSTQEARVGSDFTDFMEEVRKDIDAGVPDTTDEIYENTLAGGDVEELPPVMLPSSGGGALGGLNAWATPTVNATPTEEGDRSGDSAPQNSAEATSSTPVVFEPVPPPPRKTSVILIGTTTSKKIE